MRQETSLDFHLLVRKIRCSEILFLHLFVQQISIKQLFYAKSWVRKRPHPCPWIIVFNLLTHILNFFVCICSLFSQQDSRFLEVVSFSSWPQGLVQWLAHTVHLILGSWICCCTIKHCYLALPESCAYLDSTIHYMDKLLNLSVSVLLTIKYG